MKSLGMFKGALAAVNGELAARKTRRDELKEEIAGIDRQIAELRGATISVEDLKVYLAQFVLARGKAYSGSLYLGGWFTQPGTGRDESLKRPWSWFENDNGEYNPMSILAPNASSLDGADVFGALCFFFPEQVAIRLGEAAQAQAGARHANEAAIPVSERRKRIKALKAQREPLLVELASVEADIKEVQSAFTM